jgi:hypothetical protein
VQAPKTSEVEDAQPQRFWLEDLDCPAQAEEALARVFQRLKGEL